MDLFWEKHNWEEQDEHLLRVRAMPFRRAFDSLVVSKGLCVIRGPRQVGKSSWLKTLLSQTVKKVGAENCFYETCEEIEDFKHLSEILKMHSARKYVFLDEVTYVREWWRPIKKLLDSGAVHAVVVTGSNSIDLRKGSDLMPGRHAKGGEYFLRPMDFEEFREARKQAGWCGKTRLEEFEIFFRVGGFPKAVAEAGPDGVNPVNAKEVYLKWLQGDVLKAGKQLQYLREVMGQLCITMGTPMSLQSLASKTQIGSHHTAQEYVQLLEDCFALGTLYAIDPNDASLRFKKGKKFYFLDPLIYWIALEWSGRDKRVDANGVLAEMVAFESLSRKYPRFGYLQTSRGEVDFIAPKKWAIEVKWSDSNRNLSRTYLDLSLPTKLCWTKHNFFEEFPPS
ncbi:ATP-binding protein [Bdellovibrionota bacterium FG-2]